MEIIAYGDNALLINFEQKIDSETHQLVKSYHNAIINIEEVVYQIPAYCSITVVFDNESINFEILKDKIKELGIKPEQTQSKSKIIEIPVCYETDYAPDIESLAQDLKLSQEDIISLHTSQTYDVYMMGFLPGFPYLGKLPKELECKRKSTPRKFVKSGSVGLAGIQTGIYPSEAPGGWQLIGQTPLKIFNSRKEEPFLLKMGDLVKFYTISATEFKKIQDEAK
ncbi:5-oxoprolinase subunit PxpB [Marivirga harenae]|uniref:5-oxoprolinase subunit PxpB n=1 Tax=Marivirga harenae TaxID=2010992 RepID=UPI0026DEB153|nr:5-oxoprolinase subunit PxpB [Marivirga harenae]WKV14098.1 5-oxoprolinase subunit PxpB [Marivirga harenae]